MKKCFFCDIQKKESPGFFLENQLFFSILDDFPISKGHCLIVPKTHIDSFF